MPEGGIPLGGAACFLAERASVRRAQFLNYGAGALAAFFAIQPRKLFFQRLQRFQLLLHAGQAFANQLVRKSAIAAGILPESKQAADFIEADAMSAAVQNEAQPIQVFTGIDTVIGFVALRRRQQPFLFIETDCDYRTAGRLGQLADPQLHGGLDKIPEHF